MQAEVKTLQLAKLTHETDLQNAMIEKFKVISELETLKKENSNLQSKMKLTEETSLKLQQTIQNLKSAHEESLKKYNRWIYRELCGFAAFGLFEYYRS